MGRAKIPRKSTNIDMTAMCDVAFLLLSFFILATKTKPPEAVTVNTPLSVSQKVPKEDAVIVTLNKEGKVFLMLSDRKTKNDIIDNFNTTMNLQLSPAELAKLKKSEFIGLPSNKLKSAMNMEGLTADQMEGIPTGDSAHNEMVNWMRSIKTVYGEQQGKMELLVKGDQLAKYPVFRNLLDAFLAVDQTKFKLITGSQTVPVGSELYIHGGKPAE